MKRKVTVRRSVSGVQTVTVSLTDGDRAASWTVKAHYGIARAAREASAQAIRALDEIKEA